MITPATLFETLLGRDAESLRLRERDAAVVRENRGATIALAGEAGVGKSRLVGAFLAVNEHRTVARVRCARASAAPYSAALELLSQLLRHRQVAIRGIAEDALAALEMARAEHDPFAEAARRHATIVDALSEASRRAGSLILVLDDAHESDMATLDTVVALAATIERAPCLLLITYRPEELSRDARRSEAFERILGSGADRIVVAPLKKRWMRAAVERVIPNDLVTIERICDLADGNPFVAEELCRSFVERRHTRFEIPVTAALAIESRLDELETGDRETIEHASAFGRDFALEDLLEGRARDEVVAALRRACERQLIEETGDRFRFRHALTREVVYARLLRAEARALHRAIAARLAARPEPPLAEIAFHLWSARDAERAPLANESAGDAASARGAMKDAAEHYIRALEFRIDDARVLVRIAQKAVRAYNAIDEFNATRSLNERVASELRNRNLFDEAARHEIWAARTTAVLNRNDEALELLERLPRIDDPPVAIDALVARAQILTRLDRWDEAAALLTPSSVEAASDRQRFTIEDLRAQFAIFRCDIEAARAAHREACRLAEASHGHLLPLALLNYATSELFAGNIAEGRRLIAGSIAAASERGALGIIGRAQLKRARCDLLGGDLRAVRAALEERTVIPEIRLEEIAFLEASLKFYTVGDIAAAEAQFDRSGQSTSFELCELGALVLLSQRADPASTAQRLARLEPYLEAVTPVFPLLVAFAAFGRLDIANRAIARYEELGGLAREPGPAAYLTLAHAHVSARDGDAPSSAALAREAAAAFEAAGYRIEQARALALAGASSEARAILADCGALEALAHADTPAGEKPQSISLSAREEQVAQLFARGLSSREVGERLAIAPRTVETHLNKVYNKLHVRTRAGLAEYFARERSDR